MFREWKSKQGCVCDFWWYNCSSGEAVCSLYWQLQFWSSRICFYRVYHETLYLNFQYTSGSCTFFTFQLDWNCRYFLKAGYSVIFLYRRFVSSALLCITIILISSLWKKVYAPDWIFKAIKLNICRGTCQPFCRSLPEDPLLECFTSTDDSNSQGLLIFHLCSIKMHKIFSF